MNPNPKLASELAEAIGDAADYLRNGTPIHPGSDLATNILSLDRILRWGPGGKPPEVTVVVTHGDNRNCPDVIEGRETRCKGHPG